MVEMVGGGVDGHAGYNGASPRGTGSRVCCGMAHSPQSAGPLVSGSRNQARPADLLIHVRPAPTAHTARAVIGRPVTVQRRHPLARRCRSTPPRSSGAGSSWAGPTAFEVRRGQTVALSVRAPARHRAQRGPGSPNRPGRGLASHD